MVFLDVEHVDEDPIEVGFVRCRSDFSILASGSRRIKPLLKRLTPEVTALTGIGWAELRGCQTFGNVSRELAKIGLKNEVVFSYGSDVEFLERIVETYGKIPGMSPVRFCKSENNVDFSLVIRAMTGTRLSQSKALETFGYPELVQYPEHRALNDAISLMHLVRVVLSRSIEAAK